MAAIVSKAPDNTVKRIAVWVKVAQLKFRSGGITRGRDNGTANWS
jgi:hypothetical protein